MMALKFVRLGSMLILSKLHWLGGDDFFASHLHYFGGIPENSRWTKGEDFIHSLALNLTDLLLAEHVFESPLCKSHEVNQSDHLELLHE